MTIDRRALLQAGLATGFVANVAQAAPAVKAAIPFADLAPAQQSLSPRVDAYARAAMDMSRVAALTTRCELDVRYGEALAQRLDVYMPADASLRDLPVFVNIHGGGWLIGYKEWCGLNAPALVDLPAIYVSVEYGLMPGTPHPGAMQDCFRAVGWIVKNIARYGGDPKRIHIGGHSAGGHLAALVTLRRDLQAKFGIPAGTIRSCFPFSGIFDLRDLDIYGHTGPSPAPPNFTSTADQAADSSPITFVRGNKVPFYVTWAENDGALIRGQGSALVLALRNEGAHAEGQAFAGFDHFWIHLDQASPTSVWTRTLRAWMRGEPTPTR
jgi:acetyl esterase/lipase